MSLSFDSMRRKNVSKFDQFLKILKRSLILYFLGLLGQGEAPIDSLRIPGVLAVTLQTSPHITLRT